MIDARTLVEVELWLVEAQSCVRRHFDQIRAVRPAPPGGWGYLDPIEAEWLEKLETYAARMLAARA